MWFIICVTAYCCLISSVDCIITSFSLGETIAVSFEHNIARTPQSTPTHNNHTHSPAHVRDKGLHSFSNMRCGQECKWGRDPITGKQMVGGILWNWHVFRYDWIECHVTILEHRIYLQAYSSSPTKPTIIIREGSFMKKKELEKAYSSAYLPAFLDGPVCISS